MASHPQSPLVPLAALPPLVGLAVTPEKPFRMAALPLLEAGVVDVIEWSFDRELAVPLDDGFNQLLDHYADQRRLVGHGVRYSLLTLGDAAYHTHWLDQARASLERRPYRHVTEHFGFSRGGDFHDSAPLPMPLTDELFAHAVARVHELQTACAVPVGIENLGFAWSAGDSISQAHFVTELCSATSAFLLLDLHNLFCQMVNFGINASEALDVYAKPELVREVHVSGGSWQPSQHPTPARMAVRRDTHDDRIPEPVFELLEATLQRCPNLEVIMFEQLASSLAAPAAAEQFQEDFYSLRSLVGKHTGVAA